MQTSRRHALIILASLPLMFSASQAFATATDFENIVASVRAEAFARGVSERTLNRALAGIKPLTIRQFETNQPERSQTITFAEYYGRHVSPNAINKGRQFWQAHASKFERAERETGVPATVILSILNIETRYGSNIGDQKVIPALLTLVRDIQGNDERARERRAMFHEEAVQALMLVDEGYEEILTGVGSWAGAVGPGQFMPSSIRRYGVDGDGDGKKDLWHNYNDIIPSIANFLKEKGWHSDQRWGRKVQVPEGFDKALMTDTLKHQINKTPNEWSSLGIKLPDGGKLPDDSTMRAMMIAPNYNVKKGVLKSPYYMVYDNFRTVMEYNKSYKYALTVLQMSDALGNRPQISYSSSPSPAPYNQ